MNSFSLTCTTCQAKLRVRDASAIGQILTCPKCGSMVLVESPAGRVEAPSPVSAATESPSAAKPPPRPRVAPREPASRAVVDDKAVLPAQRRQVTEFADTVEDLTQYGTFDSDAVPRVPLPPAAIHPPSDEAGQDDGPADSEESSTSDESTSIVQRRPWLFAALAGTAGVVLAMGLFAWMASGKVEPVSQGKTQPPGKVIRVPPESASPESGKTSEAPVDVDAATSGRSTTEANADPPPAIESPSSASPPPVSPPVETPVHAADATPATSPLASTNPLPPPPPAPPPIDVQVTSGDAVSPDRNTKTRSLEDTLRKLGGLFDTETPSESPKTSTVPDAPLPGDTTPAPTTPAAKPAEGASPPPPPRTAPRNVNVAARLKDPILEIQFSDLPLNEFLRFVSDYSTIPITLEPDVLKWLNITPTTPVTLAMKDTSVARLLDEVLGKLGLAYHTADQQLIVTYKSLTEGKRPAKLNLSDLAASGDAHVQEILEHIRNLIAPGTWNGTDQGGSLRIDGSTLVVEHNNNNLFRVIEFCEKLRVARGMALRSKFDPKHFQLATRSQRATAVLAKPVTLNYPRPTSFLRVVARIAKETGLSLVVDWQAAAYAGWYPDAEVTFTVSNKSASEALDALLSPVGLTYRAVDEQVLQITTPQAAKEQVELEFYRLDRPLDAGRNWKVQLKALLDKVPAEWLRAGGGIGEIRYDPSSQCLLVSLPQPHQQSFEKLLVGARLLRPTP